MVVRSMLTPSVSTNIDEKINDSIAIYTCKKKPSGIVWLG